MTTASGAATACRPAAECGAKRELARTETSPKLLPDTPINLPKLRAADVKLRYRGEHILGRSVGPMCATAISVVDSWITWQATRS